MRTTAKPAVLERAHVDELTQDADAWSLR